MAGTKAGGKQAASANKGKYGDDFYKRIGALGGKKGRTGGFFANRDLARKAGRLGGSLSRRTKPLSEKERLEVLRAYDHLLRVHDEAQAERKLADKD